MPDTLRVTLQGSLGTAYTLARELGGGAGTRDATASWVGARVFIAEEIALGRRVVLKTLAPLRGDPRFDAATARIGLR